MGEEGAAAAFRGDEEAVLWGGGELPLEEQESRSMGSSSCMNTCNKMTKFVTTKKSKTLVKNYLLYVIYCISKTESFNKFKQV
jgi:hypothetical protein